LCFIGFNLGEQHEFTENAGVWYAKNKHLTLGKYLFKELFIYQWNLYATIRIFACV